MQRRCPSLKSAETVSAARHALNRESVKITECASPVDAGKHASALGGVSYLVAGASEAGTPDGYVTVEIVQLL
jgi:hypothetical protein